MHRCKIYFNLLTTECGYTCHAKCQMKAPQDCTGVNLKAEAKKAKKKKKGKNGEEEDDDSIDGSLKRTSTGSSLAQSINTPTSAAPTSPRTSVIRRISRKQLAPPFERHVPPPPANGGSGAQKAKVLYTYDANSSQELSVKANDVITIVEADDGSGWVLARAGRNEGLIPASYVGIQSSESAPKKGPPVAPRRGAKKAEESKKKYYKAVYDYDAGSELELSIREGDVFILVTEDKGDGWTEVEMKGRIGSVPSNYIEPTTAP